MSWGAEARDGRVVDQVGVHAGDDHVAVIDGHGLPGLGEEDLKLDGVHAQPLDPVALQQGASAPQAVGDAVVVRVDHLALGAGRDVTEVDVAVGGVRRQAAAQHLQDGVVGAGGTAPAGATSGVSASAASSAVMIVRLTMTSSIR
jgi:hypothetical protein